MMALPKDLDKLKNLEAVNMQSSHLVAFPPSFAHLGKLTRFYAHRSTKLEQAAFFSSSLTLLNLGHCPRLQRVAGLDGLKSLEYLVLSNCYQLKQLSGLAGLESLKGLNISGCGMLYSRAVASQIPDTLRQLQLSRSHVIPSTHLLQLPRLEHITCFGSQMPSDFNRNHDRPRVVEAVENADELFQSPTFVEGVLVRGRSREGTVQQLYRNRHAELRDQVHVVILRRDQSKLLRNARVGDKIEIRARSVYLAWRITVKQASYIVVMGGSEQLNSCLKDISLGWMKDCIAVRQIPRIPFRPHALNIEAGPLVFNAIERQRLMRLLAECRPAIRLESSSLRDHSYAHIYNYARNRDLEGCIFCTFSSLINLQPISSSLSNQLLLPVQEANLVSLSLLAHLAPFRPAFSTKVPPCCFMQKSTFVSHRKLRIKAFDHPKYCTSLLPYLILLINNTHCSSYQSLHSQATASFGGVLLSFGGVLFDIIRGDGNSSRRDIRNDAE
ncbi:hypothetical protein L7F22_044559 [Adiantum nelumboides]|nr:hypothetical protein [Adiantum nelumboides]